MYKKIRNIIIFMTICFIFILTFKKYQLLTKSLIETSLMFTYNVFPFLFITIFLNYLLIDFNLPYYFQIVFHNKYLYIFFMSIMSGTPNSAIIIEKFLKNDIITENDASILLAFTTFNSPLFLYYYLNKIFINNLIAIKIIGIIYISNILLFIIYNKKLSNTKDEAVVYKQINILNSLTSSIKNAIKAIINIYATILVFKMISDILLPQSTILRGLIEITQGLDLLSKTERSIKQKELLSLVILSFGGLCIHMQICSVLQKYQINYKYFYISRIFYIIISIIINYSSI